MSTKKSLYRAATSILCLSLVACAGRSVETIDYAKTEKVPGNKAEDRAAEGIAYALPRGLITIAASWDGKSGAPKVEFKDTQILPDSNARYRARWLTNALADDSFALEVSDGLLSSANVTTKDQTGAAIGKVVEIAAEAAKAATLKLRDVALPQKPKAAYDRTIVFDPFRGWQSDSFEALGLKVDVRLLGDKTFRTGGSLGEPVAAPACHHSLCYRDPIAVVVRVTDFSGASREAVTLIPDTRVTSGIDIDRVACVEGKTALTFTKGVLTKVDLTKPSEVVGCLDTILLQPLRAIVSVPGELLKFETGNIDAERALIEAQTNYIKALEARAAALAPASDNSSSDE